MATYYGQVLGNRETPATRTGSKQSGIQASVQSWDGSVILWLREVDGENRLQIEVNKDSKFSGTRIFDGTIEELAIALAGKHLEDCW